MFGVLDGHGTHGHFVSNYSKVVLVEEFEKQMSLGTKPQKIVQKKRLNGSMVVENPVINPNEPSIATTPEFNQSTRNKTLNKRKKLVNSIEVHSLYPSLEIDTELSRLDGEGSRTKSRAPSNSDHGNSETV